MLISPFHEPDPCLPFVQDTVKNKSWHAHGGVGVVSHVFTTNDSRRPNPTLCGALDGLLCLCLYPGGGQWGQMVKQATSCSPRLHFVSVFGGCSRKKAAVDS